MNLVYRDFKIVGFVLFRESAAPFATYDSGFARENIRLEKDVLSKLGVKYIINYLIFRK